MLLMRGAVAEVAIVADVDQHFGAAARKLAHEIREYGLVADKRSGAVAVDLEIHHTRARDEVADFMRDAVHPAEHRWNELTERNQVHFVVAALNGAAWVEHEGRVQGIAMLVVAHRAEEKIGLRVLGDARDVIAEGGLVGIE